VGDLRFRIHLNDVRHAELRIICEALQRR
jgi:hypothetical protein